MLSVALRGVHQVGWPGVVVWVVGAIVSGVRAHEGYIRVGEGVAVAMASGCKPRSRRRRTVVAGVADEVAVEILLAEVAGERSVVVD